jgi:exopolysaccharide biosynthesis protein
MERALEPKDISSEEWREYDFGGRVYRIESPQRLYVGTTTHRVVDAAGVTHCVPAPGFEGCAVRWKAAPEVSF